MTDEKIPICKVIDDMQNLNGGPVVWAARDYYYTNYASPEEQREMDKEDKLEAAFAFGFLFSMVAGLVLAVIFLYF